MKTLRLLLPLLMTCPFLRAQDVSQSILCEPSFLQAELHVNAIQARILNNGALFTDFSDGGFVPNPTPNGPNPSTMWAAGLWLGGWDPAGTLQFAGSTYASGGSFDYWPGPLNNAGITESGVCATWDRLFPADGAEIAGFLNNLSFWAINPGQAVAEHAVIMGWPGRGNPYFMAVHGFELPPDKDLAPFVDADQDGIYNPLSGD